MPRPRRPVLHSLQFIKKSPRRAFSFCRLDLPPAAPSAHARPTPHLPNPSRTPGGQPRTSRTAPFSPCSKSALCSNPRRAERLPPCHRLPPPPPPQGPRHDLPNPSRTPGGQPRRSQNRAAPPRRAVLFAPDFSAPPYPQPPLCVFRRRTCLSRAPFRRISKKF